MPHSLAEAEMANCRHSSNSIRLKLLSALTNEAFLSRLASVLKVKVLNGLTDCHLFSYLRRGLKCETSVSDMNENVWGSKCIAPGCSRAGEIVADSYMLVRGILILLFKRYPILHAPMFCHLPQGFQNCFCFCSTTKNTHFGYFGGTKVALRVPESKF